MVFLPATTRHAFFSTSPCFRQQSSQCHIRGQGWSLQHFLPYWLGRFDMWGCSPSQKYSPPELMGNKFRKIPHVKLFEDEFLQLSSSIQRLRRHCPSQHSCTWNLPLSETTNQRGSKPNRQQNKLVEGGKTRRETWHFRLFGLRLSPEVSIALWEHSLSPLDQRRPWWSVSATKGAHCFRLPVPYATGNEQWGRKGAAWITFHGTVSPINPTKWTPVTQWILIGFVWQTVMIRMTWKA